MTDISTTTQQDNNNNNSSSSSSSSSNEAHVVADPWEVEDDQLARQCEDHEPLWNQFWTSVYPKKSRTFSEMGLLVAMFLAMASAMLRIKSR
eukprot:scaffold120_cov59-Cylindrotheca_fusiformis.AAC.10